VRDRQRIDRSRSFFVGDRFGEAVKKALQPLVRHFGVHVIRSSVVFRAVVPL
jgi:hypothetical protein